MFSLKMNYYKTRNVCRTCLSEEGPFQSVSFVENNFGLLLQISEMINACATIQVAEGDELPEQICTSCAELTLEMYLFKLTCEKSDRILRERLGKVINGNQANEAETAEPTFNLKIKIESDYNALSANFIEDYDKEGGKNILKIKEKKIKRETIDIKSCLETKPQSCDVCYEGFSHTSKLKNHMKTHDKTSKDGSDQKKINTRITYLCKICDKSLLSKSELSAHLKMHTEVSPSLTYERTRTIKKPCKLNICQNKYSKAANLVTHTKFNRIGKPYNNEQLTRLEGLNNHNRKHIGEKPYKCNICKKKFLQLGNLKTHKGIHWGEKPYECNICKKQFSQLGNLKTHEGTHRGERPYECDICKKQFSQLGNLKTHEGTHRGERPYECDLCKKKFSQLGNLKTHIGTHRGEKPYECDICKKKYSQLGNLKSHRKKSHG